MADNSVIDKSMANEGESTENASAKNLIIGGGPAGSYLAYLLAKKGQKVDLYERNPRQDKNPKPCSGGTARWWLNKVGVPISNEFVADTIKTVRILYGTETIWEATPSSDAGLILTRGKFERFLQKEAADMGANVHYEARYNHFEGYDHVFLAEGARGQIKKSLGMDERRKMNDFHMGVQLIGSGPVEPHTIEVYADDMLQGGYLWRFPSELGVEVGLGIPASRARDAWPILNKWIEKMGWKINAQIRQTHIIPTNYPQRQDFGKVMILGDNAYLTSPISGGGIHAALYSALRASEGRTVGKKFAVQSRIMYMARNRVIEMEPARVAELIKGLDGVSYDTTESPYGKLVTVLKMMRGGLGLVF
jgi:flavin-dependent dehydrogenase